MISPLERTVGTRSHGFSPFLPQEMEQSIPARFEQQARLYPGEIAVQDLESAVTYHDLNRLANRIAHALLAVRGVGPEPVALLMGNGVPVVAAMLGVLKAGKFYVALDASQPHARTAAVLDSIRPRLLIADGGRLPQAEALRAATTQILDLDNLAEELSEENPDLPISPADLAYVIFTSGSTGKPKGVMQDHRYVLHLTMVYTNTGQISAADRLALLYSPNFAGAVRDIYCTLLNGATLFTFDVKREGMAHLAAWLQRQEITVFFAVATMFRHFCRLLTPQDRFPAMRLIELGSETVHTGEVLLYQRHFSDGCRMVVNLGGSEISPICQFAVDHSSRIEGSTVPAGYPAAGVELLLRDADGRPVQAGAAGEIIVRSRYLARGYWDRPEFTAAAFLPDPEGGDLRLFRTGDLGRLLPDGCLLHLGRCDFQVKIRGYRVETAEVEDFFTGTGLIRDAAVAAWMDAAGEQVLAAWLVPLRPEAPPSIGELRALAKAALPDYMVPASFVLMGSLPTTQSGKLDRRALPDPRQAARHADTAYMPPRTAVELRLQEIWGELLDRERIGIHDNFFDFGGHSLLAMQVTARAAAAFHVALRPTCLFEAPTMAQLAELVEHARGIEPDETIAPGPRSAESPLSLAQQRLWVLARMQGPTDTFNMARAFQLEGSLDHAALERALAEIGRRHDNLRAIFTAPHGVPMAAIVDASGPARSSLDLREEPDSQREAALHADLREACARCFDLTTGPLWRVRVIRLEETRHVLLLTMHHIVSDDWSVQVMLRELSAGYGGLAARDLAVQYADYANWHRRWLTGARLTQQLDYWQEHLHDAPPLLELPLDRPRRAGESFRAGMVRLRLDGERTAQLRRLSRESETTLFVTLLAAWGLLLSRYGNPEDVVVGTAVANRYPVETEALIGFFVNLLPLRLRWEEGATFRQIQASAHRAAIGGFAHPDVPFDRIVEALQPDRQTLHSPIFQTSFVLQNVPRQELGLSGLNVTALDLHRPTAGAAFDLTLSLTETGGELRGALEFNSALFDTATIERMAAHFETLLAAIVRAPDTPAERLPLMNAEERRRTIECAPYPPQPAWCLHDRFDQQAAGTPHAAAVTCQGATWSYQELQRRSNRLAHRLQALGVGPETLVGLCMERSVHTVAGILGILKAGGAYLPLDPANPPERLAGMARDAGLRIMVTDDTAAAVAPACEHVIRLNGDEAAWRQWSDETPRSGATPDSLAYVIYTSGSTGRSKGALITHRNVSRLFTSTCDSLEFDRTDVWSLFHSFAFDFSVWELWGALLHGGRVVVVPQAVSRDPDAFYRLLAEEGVTVLSQTPSAFHHLIRVDQRAARLLNLRLVMVGGEAWDPGMLRPWFERHGDRHPSVVNGYGPTETTAFATFRPLGLPDTATASNRIGRAISDLDTYVLDRLSEPVPVGVVGELHIGGAGLARGYLHRPELTAERFIAHPFSSDPATRLYKTGDLVRRLSDGDLEYRGRADNQVKIRGYRIELGEIEAALAAHPAVAEAVVVLHQEGGGEKQLVAYLAPRTQPCVAGWIDDVRRQAQRSLPDYMLPAVFVPLERLPLNSNGKVDRRALPTPSATATREHTAEPANPIEEVAAAALAGVLGLERLGRDDNFFEWGGHSLLAVQAVSHLCDAFQVELPIRCLFETPTARRLARAIETRLENGAVASPVIERLPPGTLTAPLSYAQQQMWVMDQIEGPSATYIVSCAFQVDGPLDVPALASALAEVSRRHTVLRTAFDLACGAPVQVVDESATARLEVRPAPLLDTDVQRFVTAESQRPFDLTSAPLLRATLLARSGSEHVLVLAMHHILADGLSLGILFQEWSALYRAFRAGEPAPLPPLPIQYADYAAWQRRWFQGEVLAGQVAYWKQQLAGAPALLTLPTDRPRPAVQTFRGGIVTVPIEDALVHRLEALSRKSGATLFMTLLAAYAALLAHLSGQDDVVVGSPISERDRRECEPLIGYFVNMLALRVLTGGASFLELLARVRQVAVEGYAHHSLPFEQVVEAIGPERSLGHTPLFQAMFSLEPRTAAWEIPGVSVTPIEKDHLVAKCDLTLSISEQGKAWHASFEYSEDLFDRATVAQWSRRFVALLAAVGDNPNVRAMAL